MSTLLDRLLEVAKDFEAERLQDQLTSQRRERQLEQDLKALKRTAMYRADEISFLENQLQDARTEVDTANEALKEAQDQNIQQASTTEVDMKREIVCLRLEIGRLRSINNKLAEKVDGSEKENSAVANGDSRGQRGTISAEIEALEDPVILSRESIDIHDTASDLYRAAEAGDISTMEELLSPSCVCLDSYEQLVTRALSSMCAASTAATRSAPRSPEQEFVVVGQDINIDSAASKKDAAAAADDASDAVADIMSSEATTELKLRVAKLLIEEGAITTTAFTSASGSGTNAVKKAKSVPAAPLHMAAWSGDGALVELLLSQPNAPLNDPCESIDRHGVVLKGTPLQLAIKARRGTPSAVVKALLMAGADPSVLETSDDTITSETMTMTTATTNMTPEMKSIFEDCTVMFWNSSVRAFEAYSSSKYDKALDIWGGALGFIKQGNLPISGPDKARLHYNRVSNWMK